MEPSGTGPLDGSAGELLSHSFHRAAPLTSLFIALT